MSRASGGDVTRITIVVVVYNGGDLLRQCIEALAATTAGAAVELVLLDNASKDGCFDPALRLFPGASAVRLARNVGFAAGVNHALGERVASGDDSDIVVLVNQDCIMRPDWLRPVKDRLRDASVGVVGCRILDADGVTLQHAGGRIERNGLTSHIGRGCRDARAYLEPADVEYVTGAVCAFRVGTWRRFGPFDAGYFPVYFEETDFCVRVRRGGKRVVYEPRSVAIHHEATASGGAAGVRFLRHYHRNRLRFAVKHLFVPGNRLAFLDAELRWLSSPKSIGHIAALMNAYLRVPLQVFEARKERRSG